MPSDTDTIPGVVFNKAVSEHKCRVRSVAARLDALAEAFAETGSARTGEILGGLSDALLVAVDELDVAHGRCVSDEHREAMGSVASILTALVARPEPPRRGASNEELRT